MELKWIPINNQRDIETLQENFSFHDSCIKEMRYESGMWVNEDLSMMPLNSLRNLYVVFQTQWKDCPSIEMLFEEVEWLNLRPVSPEYSGNLYGADIFFEDGLIVWYGSGEFTESQIERYQYNDVTWIKAHRAKWRKTDYLGEQQVYVNRDLHNF